MHLVAAEGGHRDRPHARGGEAAGARGDRGLSRKGALNPARPPYYYSLTRMPAAGTVRAGRPAHAVAGLAWMDREWSTSSLGRDQVGWDWFALQLDDGRELMLYRLRAARMAGAEPASQGTLVPRDGTSRPLAWARCA